MADFTPTICRLKKIQIPDFDNHADVAKFILDILDKNNGELNRIFTELYEHQMMLYSNMLNLLLFLCNKVGIDFFELQREANIYFNNNWEKIQKDVKEQINLKNKLDDIFNVHKKEGNSPSREKSNKRRKGLS